MQKFLDAVLFPGVLCPYGGVAGLGFVPCDRPLSGRTRCRGGSSSAQVLVFVSSKQGCDDLCKSLNQHTSLQAGAIHGDRDQTDRQDVHTPYVEHLLVSQEMFLLFEDRYFRVVHGRQERCTADKCRVLLCILFVVV